MKKIIISLGVFALTGMIGMAIVNAQNGTVEYRLPQGIYIELPEEFKESIGGELADEDVWLYTDKMAGVYLNQIVQSNEKVVQTNNEIIRQQERIIQLLEALIAKPAADEGSD
jgi:hypothetical protein